MKTCPLTHVAHYRSLTMLCKRGILSFHVWWQFFPRVSTTQHWEFPIEIWHLLVRVGLPCRNNFKDYYLHMDSVHVTMVGQIHKDNRQELTKVHKLLLHHKFYMLSLTLVRCPGLHAHFMHTSYDKHHKVSSFLKVTKTHNSVKCEVI